MATVEIVITGWDKYNPKRNQATYTWLRLENDFYTGEKLFNLTPSERYLWVVILCLASKKNKENVRFSTDHLAYTAKIEENIICSAIAKFAQAQLIEIKGSDISHNIPLHQTTPAQHCTTPTYERTNERTNNNAQPSPVVAFDFEAVYQNYPRKIGKKLGIERCKKKIKSQAKYDKLVQAVENYAADCQIRNIEQKYIKHFSTFMNSWEDWAEIEKPVDPLLKLFHDNGFYGTPINPESEPTHE